MGKYNYACTHWKKDSNFEARYTYGNKSKGLKIMHWNAGDGLLTNKLPVIENVISKYVPHVMGISESYFSKDHKLEDIQINDYKVYMSKTLENPNLNVSRVAVFVHRDVSKVKLRNDLMDDQFSSIWLEWLIKNLF